MLKETTSFDFIKYLANGNGGDRLPSLQELSAEHGVSISVLREQLQVARALGFVEVRPRTGIKRLPYTFAPEYQLQVWDSHRQIVEAIAEKDFVRGHQLLVGHFDLIDKRNE